MKATIYNWTIEGNADELSALMWKLQKQPAKNMQKDCTAPTVRERATNYESFLGCTLTAFIDKHKTMKSRSIINLVNEIALKKGYAIDVGRLTASVMTAKSQLKTMPPGSMETRPYHKTNIRYKKFLGKSLSQIFYENMELPEAERKSPEALLAYVLDELARKGFTARRRKVQVSLKALMHEYRRKWNATVAAPSAATAAGDSNGK